MSKNSAEARGEPWYSGKHCHECYNCGTLIEYKWHENDMCSCEIDDED